MNKRLLIFDLDGTILYTLEDLKESLNDALGHMGYPRRTLEETRNFVGNGIRKLIERAVPVGTAEADIQRTTTGFWPTTGSTARTTRHPILASQPFWRN